jgi:hypothetical protein
MIAPLRSELLPISVMHLNEQDNIQDWHSFDANQQVVKVIVGDRGSTDKTVE